jgi:outer membrane protein TolC
MRKAVNVKMSDKRCSGTAAISVDLTTSPHAPIAIPRPSKVHLVEPTTPLAPAGRWAGERGECRTWVRMLACAICASLLFSFGSASAAEPKILTLDDALTIAMERNRDIGKARAYGQYVQGRYLEERSAALPSLSLNAGAGYARDESQSALTGGISSTQTRTGELRLNQTLFSWGKISAAIRGAEEGLKTSEDRLRLYQQAARRDTTVAFYDVLLARELRALALSNLQQKERHLAEAQKRLSAGVATDYDLLAAQVAVDNARPAVIRSENRIRTAKERLRLVLALEGGELEVAGNLATAPVAVPAFEEALNIARARRPELSELRHRIGIYRELVQIASAGNKPTVEFTGTAGWRQLEAAGQTFDGPAWTAGINLSFPFFDGFKTRGKVQQARSDLRTGELEEAQQMDAVSLEVRNAGFAVTEAEQIVQALTGTVRQAERLLAMAEQGYQLGVKIRLEVEDAETNVVQARSNLAQARRDYQVALVDLAWATGTLGERREL